MPIRKLWAIHNWSHSLLPQCPKKTLNGHLSPAPFGRIEFSEEMDGAHVVLECIRYGAFFILVLVLEMLCRVVPRLAVLRRALAIFILGRRSIAGPVLPAIRLQLLARLSLLFVSHNTGWPALPGGCESCNTQANGGRPTP